MQDAVVAAYLATGNAHQASLITGVSYAAVKKWVHQDWFNEALRAAEQTKTNEIKSTTTRLAVKALEELEDRLQNGDEVLDKNGNIIKRKIGGKDLSIIAAVNIDKRKQLAELNSVGQIQNSQDKLFGLMAEFIRFANSKTITAEQAERKELLEDIAQERVIGGDDA